LRVLLVEPDVDTAEDLADALRRHKHHVDSVHTGSDALRVVHHADLLLLDLELPDIDGLEVCRAVRAARDIPIIAVTTRSSELDRVLGLQAGADDYVVKPYWFRELMARIGAVMRRCTRRATAAEVLDRGPLRLDPSRREVRLDGRPIVLTRKEFDLLHLLSTRPGTVFSRRELAQRVWDDNCSASSRTIDTHVSSVRTKLGGNSWIVTVRGVGFRFGPGHDDDDGGPTGNGTSGNGTSGNGTSGNGTSGNGTDPTGHGHGDDDAPPACPHCGAPQHTHVLTTASPERPAPSDQAG
jgi:DNA-binding response OmpR family regulator